MLGLERKPNAKVSTKSKVTICLLVVLMIAIVAAWVGFHTIYGAPFGHYV